MSQKDEHIEMSIGRARPFTVPEGYFEGLTTRVMDNLPMEETHVEKPHAKTRLHIFRKAIAVAAISVGVIFMGYGTWKIAGTHEPAPVASSSSHAVTPHSSYSAMDAVVDYSMMDSEDMYTYMASAE